jgi:hypothetical protein
MPCSDGLAWEEMLRKEKLSALENRVRWAESRLCSAFTLIQAAEGEDFLNTFIHQVSLLNNDHSVREWWEEHKQFDERNK